tara:strand:- start:75 stop:704 length:630 start_codon:yes stop_codon:yes gene_type:complete
MFTGIIKSLGVINKVQKNKFQLRLEICASKNIFDTTNIGDSVSVNGVCLTAINKVKDKNILFFDIVDETLQKTNLKLFKNLEKVNLETPLKISDGLDGHIVQGHVDTIGIIVNNELIDNNWLLEIKIDKQWMKYCILKGSIAIDGISLTIAKINDNYDEEHGIISISIIPHTLKKTNLQFKNRKDTVNIETDFFAKYIEKLLPKKEENE